MQNSEDEPTNPRARHNHEYEDPHYHDDDQDLRPAEDAPQAPRPRMPRKMPRKLPERRRHYEE
jgi:hypothetical protein